MISIIKGKRISGGQSSGSGTIVYTNVRPTTSVSQIIQSLQGALYNIDTNTQPNPNQILSTLRGITNITKLSTIPGLNPLSPPLGIYNTTSISTSFNYLILPTTDPTYNSVRQLLSNLDTVLNRVAPAWMLPSVAYNAIIAAAQSPNIQLIANRYIIPPTRYETSSIVQRQINILNALRSTITTAVGGAMWGYNIAYYAITTPDMMGLYDFASSRSGVNISSLVSTATSPAVSKSMVLGLSPTVSKVLDTIRSSRILRINALVQSLKDNTIPIGMGTSPIGGKCISLFSMYPGWGAYIAFSVSTTPTPKQLTPTRPTATRPTTTRPTTTRPTTTRRTLTIPSITTKLAGGARTTRRKIPEFKEPTIVIKNSEKSVKARRSGRVVSRKGGGIAGQKK